MITSTTDRLRELSHGFFQDPCPCVSGVFAGSTFSFGINFPGREGRVIDTYECCNFIKGPEN